MPHLTKSDLDALAFVGLYKTTTSPETLEIYSNYSWTREEACAKLGITRVVFSRFHVHDYDASSGVALYCPLTLAKYIKRLLEKRGRNETLRDFAAYAINQNRRCNNPKKYGGATTGNKLPAVLDVIVALTSGKPNAYRAFDTELRKIGVFLPPQQS